MASFSESTEQTEQTEQTGQTEPRAGIVDNDIIYNPEIPIIKAVSEFINYKITYFTLCTTIHTDLSNLFKILDLLKVENHIDNTKYTTLYTQYNKLNEVIGNPYKNINDAVDGLRKNLLLHGYELNDYEFDSMFLNFNRINDIMRAYTKLLGIVNKSQSAIIAFQINEAALKKAEQNTKCSDEIAEIESQKNTITATDGEKLNSLNVLLAKSRRYQRWLYMTDDVDTEIDLINAQIKSFIDKVIALDELQLYLQNDVPSIINKSSLTSSQKQEYTKKYDELQQIIDKNKKPFLDAQTIFLRKVQLSHKTLFVMIRFYSRIKNVIISYDDCINALKLHNLTNIKPELIDLIPKITNYQQLNLQPNVQANNSHWTDVETVCHLIKEINTSIDNSIPSSMKEFATLKNKINIVNTQIQDLYKSKKELSKLQYDTGVQIVPEPGSLLVNPSNKYLIDIANINEKIKTISTSIRTDAIQSNYRTSVLHTLLMILDLKQFTTKITHKNNKPTPLNINKLDKDQQNFYISILNNISKYNCQCNTILIYRVVYTNFINTVLSYNLNGYCSFNTVNNHIYNSSIINIYGENYSVEKISSDINDERSKQLLVTILSMTGSLIRLYNSILDIDDEKSIEHTQVLNNIPGSNSINKIIHSIFYKKSDSTIRDFYSQFCNFIYLNIPVSVDYIQKCMDPISLPPNDNIVMPDLDFYYGILFQKICTIYALLNPLLNSIPFNHNCYNYVYSGYKSDIKALCIKFGLYLERLNYLRDNMTDNIKYNISKSKDQKNQLKKTSNNIESIDNDLKTFIEKCNKISTDKIDIDEIDEIDKIDTEKIDTEKTNDNLYNFLTTIMVKNPITQQTCLSQFVITD